MFVFQWQHDCTTVWACAVPQMPSALQVYSHHHLQSPQALRISLDTEPDRQDRSKPGTCYYAFSVTVTVQLALMGLTKLTLLLHIISFVLFHGFNSSGYPKRQHNRHMHLLFSTSYTLFLDADSTLLFSVFFILNQHLNIL